MNKDDCRMTFSEASEMYMENREVAQQSKPGRNRDECLVHMDVAAKHMDALTQPAPDQSAEIERLRKESADFSKSYGLLVTELGALKEQVQRVMDFLRNDALAITYQSLGQYRYAALAAVKPAKGVYKQSEWKPVKQEGGAE